jgi:hypothetical protein
MIATQVKPAVPVQTWRKVFKRTAAVLLIAFFLGYGMRHLSAALERSAAPAGFARGLLQGALMPCALPLLLVGKDISIYNENNTGVSYKLGYTSGVNACGAVFFGFFFLRLNRWRKRLNGTAKR